MTTLYLISILSLSAVIPMAILMEKNLAQVRIWQKLDEKIFSEFEFQKKSVNEILNDNRRLSMLRRSCASLRTNPAALAIAQGTARALVAHQSWTKLRVVISTGRLSAAGFRVVVPLETSREPVTNLCGIANDLDFLTEGGDVFRLLHGREEAGGRLFFNRQDPSNAQWKYFYPRVLAR